MNPIVNSEEKEIEIDNAVKSTRIEKKKALLNQINPPLYFKEHYFSPWFQKCDQKIVKYQNDGFKIWRALTSFPHTILSDWDTWYHLGILTVICFITMAIVYFTNDYKSIFENLNVTSKVQLLISFIFAAYISIVIGRWDRIRNTTLGQLWGSLENLNMVAFRVLRYDTDQEQQIIDRLIRYSRLLFLLTFKAVQADNVLTDLVDRGLILQEEIEWIEATSTGTRPLLLVGWMSELFEETKLLGYKAFGDQEMFLVQQNLMALRGGIGATLGCIGCQLPYPYVHIVYWVIQLLLTVLAIETGVVLGINLEFMSNGEGQYSPRDDTVVWPNNSKVWYMNQFFQTTAQNILLALFTEGMLKICEKLANPMSKEDTSFSERVYDAFLYNNCQAMRAGYSSYKSIYKPLQTYQSSGL